MQGKWGEDCEVTVKAVKTVEADRELDGSANDNAKLASINYVFMAEDMATLTAITK